jgi:hypothetical protein
MMGGVSPETCWASDKCGIIKFWYVVASCWVFFFQLYYDARSHERQTLQFCPWVEALHVSSFSTTLPLYGRSLRLLLFTNETNVKTPRCRFSAWLSYTRRSVSCCLTASTHCPDIPIKWTTGTSSTSFHKTREDGGSLFKTSNLCVHELYDERGLKHPINHGGRKCVWNVYQYWEESEYELLKPNREIFDVIKKLLDHWTHWTELAGRLRWEIIRVITLWWHFIMQLPVQVDSVT